MDVARTPPTKRKEKGDGGVFSEARATGHEQCDPERANDRGAATMTDFLDRWAAESPENARLVAQERLITQVTEALWQEME